MADKGFVGRAPYGARGLKFAQLKPVVTAVLSRPVWGAWIEMITYENGARVNTVAPRMGRVD